MAAPFVTGAAALYASAHPGASPTEIREAILSTAKPTKSLQGLVATNGRLDINAALGATVTSVTRMPAPKPVARA